MSDPHWEPKDHHREVEPLFGGLEAARGHGDAGSGDTTSHSGRGAGLPILIVAGAGLVLAALAWWLLG